MRVPRISALVRIQNFLGCPPCFPSPLCATLCLSHLPRCDRNMMHYQDDLVTLSSATALGIGENLIFSLMTIMVNLPEFELRKIHEGLIEGVQVADSLLRNLSIASGFEMLTMNDGTSVQHRILTQFFKSLPQSRPPLASSSLPPTTRSEPTILPQGSLTP